MIQGDYHLRTSKIVLTAIILTVMTIPSAVSQCCGPGVEDPQYLSIDSMEIITDQIWSGERFVNGSLIVDGELRLFQCDLIIGGEGIVIKENGTLIVESSSIGSYYPDVGFYIRSHGSLSLISSDIDGCLDMNNQYFSIYLLDGNVVMEDSYFKRSGLIQSHIEDVEVLNSTIPGIIAFSSNVSIHDSVIDSIGASTLNGGSLLIEDTEITTNLTFSNSIAAVSCEEGVLSMDRVNINGSYGGGVFSKNSTSNINDIGIDLPSGLYGARFENCPATTINNANVAGSQYGLEFIDCTGRSFISDSHVDTVRVGVETTGPGTLNLFNNEVKGSAYGLISSGHVNMADTTFHDNQIGLLLEGDHVLEQSNCSIENHSRYGVEVETWDPVVDLNNIDMNGGNVSKAELAFWGRTEILVSGPNGESVEGATIMLSSSLGMEQQISSGPIGLVWGFRDHDTPLNIVVYDIRASWGNAVETATFTVAEGSELEIVLPLTDIHVHGLDFKDGNAVVDLGTNGTAAEDVVVTVYLDGSYRFSQRLSLTEGENVTVELPLGDIEDGDHELKAVISSKDEYTGMNGILQNNNIQEMSIEIEDDKGDDRLQLFPIILLLVAVLFIILVILLRRKD